MMENPEEREAPVVVERVYNVSPEVIWKALTDRDEMSEWYFNLKEFKPEAGFKFEFTCDGKSGTSFLHLCEITQVVPFEKIAYTWRYDGYEGNSEVTFELFAENGKTRLRVTHEGLHTFPDSVSELGKDKFLEGWTAILGTNLTGYLDKQTMEA